MSGLFAGTPLQRPVTCERCGKPHAACNCPRDRKSGKVLDPKDQQIRVRREKRSGKAVTVVSGFSPRSSGSNDLPALLKQLRAKLGAGGSLDDFGTGFELQGDHRDRLIELLKSMGYPAKPAGG